MSQNPAKTQKHKEVVAYIGLGSNLGDRRSMLDRAIECLGEEDALQIRKVSSWYTTVPVGGPQGQAEYLNGVVEVVTSLKADELLGKLLSIEKRLGRKRQHRWGRSWCQ